MIHYYLPVRRKSTGEDYYDFSKCKDSVQEVKSALDTERQNQSFKVSSAPDQVLRIVAIQVAEFRIIEEYLKVNL